jgi:hypothetical protein
MPIPKPKKGELNDTFIKRCMSDEVMKEEYSQEQRLAVCQANYESEKLAIIKKISFDYDGVLTTKKGFDLAQELNKTNNVYIVSATHHNTTLRLKAKELGINPSHIFILKSSKQKIEKIKELKIDTHYDNNPNVVSELGNIGKLFKNE